ncbi:MAG: extradiol ring-cleavage dioxygenase [Deltaproteobacteria bacterium]|nr:extradiol ring-cleavage dioxygenase [Deltaproteobacteria bacterium]
MARLSMIIGITHNPFIYRLIDRPRAGWTPDTEKMMQRSDMLRDRLRQAKPDVLLTVGNDHFHQFFMDNMPAFCLGKMEVFDGIYYNEVREFGLPLCKLPGDEKVSFEILEGSLKRGVDFAFSNEMKIDHSIIVPLLLVRPEMDLPIVPILTNTIAPPIPTAERFHQVGKILRAVIDEIPGDKRVAAVVSGHLSLDVGGPLQFDPKPMDEEFDERAVGWISRGDTNTAIRECTFERLTKSGNVTPGFLNFLLAAGMAGGLRCTYAEGLKRKGSTQPFFAWEA